MEILLNTIKGHLLQLERAKYTDQRIVNNLFSSLYNVFWEVFNEITGSKFQGFNKIKNHNFLGNLFPKSLKNIGQYSELAKKRRRGEYV